MKSPLNVGLIGYGHAGAVFHAPLIHSNPNLRLTHIVQRTGDTAKQKYPAVHLLHSIDGLLADPSVDLVVVATPNASHVPIATRALQAGKHVVVDKPFTITSAEADQLINLAQSRGLILSVFQNRRWDGDFLTVCEILKRHTLGRLVEYESRYDRFRPALKSGAWREQDLPGSGVLYDLGSHLIDQALLLFGMPAGVYADLRCERDGAAVVDSFEVHLVYSALKVVLRAGSLVCESTPRFSLRGTEGSYTKYGLDPQEEALKRGDLPALSGGGCESEEAWGIHSSWRNGLHREKYPTRAGCYQDFYTSVFRAIHGQEELIVKAEQARKVVRLIELAQQSALQKQVVPL